MRIERAWGKRSFGRNHGRRLRWYALVVATLVVLGRVPLAGAEGGKIGFFDPQRLVVESQRLSAIRNEFEARRMAKEKEVEATQKALQDLKQMAKASSENPEPPAELSQSRGLSPRSEKLSEAKAL